MIPSVYILQIGSVTAPRKIIDLDVTDGVEGTKNNPMDKKKKKTLLDIEKVIFNLETEVVIKCF